MSDFFNARVDTYDEHMLTEVEGCRDAYLKLAELVPGNTDNILDLGCGTGLELDEIFKRLPDVSVLGIDLSHEMLNKLKRKYPVKNIRLICGSYFDIAFGENAFDTAISFQTMHHYSHRKKIELYTHIRKALKTTGRYIECDYVATDQSLEDRLYADNARIRLELNISDDEYYHFDTPCTIENQITMFRQAGFSSAGLAWQIENTAITVAEK
ncbi:MAG: class I SAM-dependent methyltransferase [Dehalococcoidales bacterium]|nr:class I SAM-dependent methyltransferase [Dehalococcoidales bacterium]